MKPMIILSAGLAGVGKTTHFSRLAERVGESVPCVFINKDQVSEDLGASFDATSEHYLKTIGPLTYQVMIEQAKKHVLEGKVVFLDGYFGNKLSARPTRDLFMNPELDVRILYFHCSAETQETRILARGSSRDEDKKGVKFSPFRREHLQSHLIELAQAFFFSVNTEEEAALDENITAILSYLDNPCEPQPTFTRVSFTLSPDESAYDEFRFSQLIKAHRLLVQFHHESEALDKFCFWHNPESEQWTALVKGLDEKPCGPGYGF